MEASPHGQDGRDDPSASVPAIPPESRPAVAGEEMAPRKVPIGEAAHTPIGPARASATSKAVDTLAVVAAPLLVPAAILAIIRTGPSRPFMSSFTLSEVAFGVVAVAFASLTRAITGKGESWKVVSAIAVIAVTFETAIAISRDSVVNSDRLVDQASKCTQACDLHKLQELASQITEASPVLLHWMVVLFVGLFVCSTTIYAIWREA